MAGVISFSKLVRKNPNLSVYYISFGQEFNASFTCSLARRGTLALIQIDPTKTSLASIAAGYYDSYLYKFAEDVKAFGSPVALSFAHEMNGSWYSWGSPHVSPAVFVAAWRQIHNVFSAAGATNVIWVWTINFIANHTESLSKLYPGNGYVDWVGVDGYFVPPGKTFDSLFGPTVREVQRITNKPILIAETGVARGDVDPASEVDSLFTSIEQDNLLGFVWFNYGSSGFSIDDDAPALAAFQRDDQRAGW